jgi:ERCC4-type nuclease
MSILQLQQPGQDDLDCEIRHLEQGDVLWVAVPRRGGPVHVLDLIMERKGLPDLVSSIKDNRYSQQKMFLSKAGLKNVMYVMEGNLNVDLNGVSSKRGHFLLFFSLC